MKSIVYDGTSDVQEFSKADFGVEGVEGKKATFPKGHVVEVEDEVADLLLEGRGVFTGYVFREPKEGDVGYQDPESGGQAEKAAANKSDENAKIEEDSTGEGASLQEDTGGPAAPAAGRTTPGTAGATGTTGGTAGTTGTTPRT